MRTLLTSNRSGRRSHRRPRQRLQVVAVLVLLTLIPAAYFLGRAQAPGVPGGAEDEFALYLEAWEAIREDYVDQGQVDPERQTYGAIRGMLDSLGDEGHTRFLTPEEVQSNREDLAGEYVGVGIQLEDREDEVVVAAPIDGSPADRAGIQPGDVILAVDGQDVSGLELTEVVERVKGDEGTSVTLTVERGDRELEFSLDRAEVRVPAVSWMPIPGTEAAQLRLASFSADASEELAAAIEEAQAAGAERFILDLRNNPGGRVDQALGIAGQFLEPGEVVYIRKDSDGSEREETVPRSADPIDAPLVVLINEGSASSSEILAGALRDNGRARVVGETSFGTGTVLNEFVLDDGSAILLGVAEWLTPNGDFIREEGIEPDVVVESPEDFRPLTPDEARDLSREEIFERDPQIERAYESLQEAR
jgi:carboxyl-terminal processing protease